jgi:hypothetical protein
MLMKEDEDEADGMPGTMPGGPDAGTQQQAPKQ